MRGAGTGKGLPSQTHVMGALGLEPEPYRIWILNLSRSGGVVVKGGRLDGAADPSGRPPITSVTGQVPLREIAVDPIILQLVPISPSLNWALMCKIFGLFGRHEG